MNISDLIENFISERLDGEKIVELKRNELANTLGCVPSQINYVISTRFTTERGYIVESRRGGGGYIKISRVEVPKSNIHMHIINSIGSSIDFASVAAITSNLANDNVISEETANAIVSALSDKALSIVQGVSAKNALRASIFKNILINLM